MLQERIVTITSDFDKVQLKTIVGKFPRSKMGTHITEWPDETVTHEGTPREIVDTSVALENRTDMEMVFCIEDVPMGNYNLVQHTLDEIARNKRKPWDFSIITVVE